MIMLDTVHDKTFQKLNLLMSLYTHTLVIILTVNASSAGYGSVVTKIGSGLAKAYVPPQRMRNSIHLKDKNRLTLSKFRHHK
jgi:hypothetical protein